MLNHIEIQGKLYGEPRRRENYTKFAVRHERGFGGETDHFVCVAEGDRVRLLDGASNGRTVIVTGRLRSVRAATIGACEIVCDTIDFVDGGKADG